MGEVQAEVVDLIGYRLKNEGGFQCSKDVACLMKKNGRIIKVAPEFTSLFGYSEADLIGKSLWDIIENSDGSQDKCIDRSNMEFPKIFVVLHKNGEKVPSILCGYLKEISGMRYGCVRFKKLNLKTEMIRRQGSSS